MSNLKKLAENYLNLYCIRENLDNFVNPKLASLIIGSWEK